MVWEHVKPTNINLTYLFFGAFTSIFMLLSTLVKDQLYLGEANVAFFTGIIFGPLAANLFDPTRWSNPDIVILECTRVVLVIQCFAVAVQLKKKYIEREWRSLLWILGPVMIWGWIISAVGIHIMDRSLSWKECMLCASCFNAIDPILAATVINDGKFAKRVPKHLRYLLLAESACNDVTTTLALELSTEIIQYSSSPRQIAIRFFTLTVGYEVVFGALAGLLIGYVAHKTVKTAMRRELMDRESFLAFYFVLALFCTGFGCLVGVDEVLLGFCAGYAFDKDDWFQDLTESSQVSDVIDLLLNLSFFVLMGAIIPWHSYNAPELDIVPWRLVAGTIFIFLVRRLPIVLILQPLIPALKTRREALFEGHFGPIGGGAIFSALVIKAQLEGGGSRQLGSSSENTAFPHLLASIWPIVTFVVLCSSIIHGTTVPIFLLGKRVTTLGITLTSTSESDTANAWVRRLPKLGASSSLRRTLSSSNSQPEKPKELVLPRTSGVNAGHTLCDAAETVAAKGKPKSDQVALSKRTPAEAFQFGNTIIVEDEAGDVLQHITLPSPAGNNSTAKSLMKAALTGLHGPSNIARSESESAQPANSGRRAEIKQTESFLERQGGHHHHLTKADVLREIQQNDPSVHVRATSYVPEEKMDFLQVPQSALFFGNRRRRVSFADEEQGIDAEPSRSSSPTIDLDTSSSVTLDNRVVVKAKKLP